jgi:hypothetical protein
MRALSQNVTVPMDYFCTRSGHSSECGSYHPLMILTLILATRMGDAIYIFGGVRDLPYSRSEQWYGEYRWAI